MGESCVKRNILWIIAILVILLEIICIYLLIPKDINSENKDDGKSNEKTETKIQTFHLGYSLNFADTLFNLRVQMK